MSTIYLVLLLFFIIGLSNIIQRFLPFIPLPLIQIALGMLCSISPTAGLHIPLEPELFFVLFIAPLLFNDGKVTPRDELWKLRLPILLLALGLVFATVVVIGLFIHWLIPSIPLPAAFALAAILSPTDVVAVSSIAKRVHMPKGLMRLLEGEGLMNDASGLVAFKFAVAATVTGIFSVSEASVSFLLIALGGLGLGVLFSFMLIGLKMALRRFGMEDITTHMIIQIITPFVIYIGAEEFGVSGILAVVAAGIVHAIEKEKVESRTLELQRVSDTTWSVILFILNGLVFVLLGLQIPDTTRLIFDDPQITNMEVIGYILAITASLLLLRYIWLALFWKKIKPLLFFQEEPEEKHRAIALLTFSGVRGAVTLAGAFTIPYIVADGSPFPERDLLLFLAAGTILVTVLLASILLPLLAKKPELQEADQQLSFTRALEQLTQEARVILADKSHSHDKQTLRRLQREYDRIVIPLLHDANTNHTLIAPDRKKELFLLFKALQHEHDLLEATLEDPTLTEAMEKRLRARAQNIGQILSVRSPLAFLRFGSKHFIDRMLNKANKNRLSIEEKNRLYLIYTRLFADIIKKLDEQMTAKNESVTKRVIHFYRIQLNRLDHVHLNNDEKLYKEMLGLHYEIMEEMRRSLQTLFQNNDLSRETTQKLRRYLNYIEANVTEALQLPDEKNGH
ncbi:Na+/H+ antiporter [Shouchella clausii]|uniref:Na+/H+ antiporter n=1 Tax=Shouchella clausii TaxID=79880 RepID=UPI000BA555B6|nr:Na+/H+ antiporter [Bacillus sp. 7520-S]